MAEAPGMKYTAIRDLYLGDVLAYTAGMPVHEDAVEGEHAWLTVGEDVEPRETAVLSEPSKRAGQAAWAAYAVSARGADPAAVAEMSRSELVERYGS